MDPKFYYCAPFFLSALLIFIAALYTLKRVNARGGWYLAMVCLCATLWSASEGLLYLGLDIKTNILITKVEYFGIAPLPPLALLFVLTVFDLITWNTRTLRKVLFTMAVLVISLIWTNPYHKQIFANYHTINSGPFPMLGLSHGPLWWAVLLYHYALLATLNMILFYQMIKASGYLRYQAALALAAILLVWVSNAVYVSGYSPIPNMDISPIAFVVVAGSMALGFFRFSLLDVLPVARAEIFRGLEDAVMVLDQKDRIVDMNPSAESLFQVPVDKIIGRGVDVLYSRFPQLANLDHDMDSVEITFSKDDTVFVYDLGVSKIKKRNGDETGTVISLRDITSRKHAVQKLKKSHQTFLAVLNGIDALIYVADVKTYKILFMNQRMVETYHQDLTGHVCHKALHSHDQPCVFCTNKQLLDNNGKPSGGCVWEAESANSRRWFYHNDRAIHWPDGRIVCLHIATDITRMKDLEKQRIEAEAQLQQAQKMESVGRLAGGVAHDFNNMLGVILGRTEILMEQIDMTPPVNANLKEIYNATCRSADLTRQLLAFARKQAVLPKVLDLNQVVTDMYKMLKRLIGENIKLIWDPKDNIWPVKIDPTQVDQILANLCVNARDAIEGIGNITIATENVIVDKPNPIEQGPSVCGEYVLLMVKDDGIGMSKDILDKLFDPFFTTKGVGDGTGLGLSTVYGIVKQNNGYIYADSSPDQGACFRIYFHRTTDPIIPIEKPTEGIFTNRSETVLLVEDELHFLRLGQTQLERYGFNVLTAQRPSEAIAIAKRQNPRIDLLITDVVMPEMNGKELRNHIIKSHPLVKVLFISGYTSNVIVNQGILQEEVDFLPKPFTTDALMTKVQEVLTPTEN